jgi:hypothetical protein
MSGVADGCGFGGGFGGYGAGVAPAYGYSTYC